MLDLLKDLLKDPAAWLFFWVVAALVILTKIDRVSVRLAVAVVAPIPVGFLVYRYEHSFVAAFAVAIGLFVFLIFEIFILEVTSLVVGRPAARQGRENEKEVDCSAEFQKLRRETWQKVCPAFVLIVITLLFLIWSGRYEDEAFLYFGAAGILAAIFWINWVCFRHYRCPGCGVIPVTGGWSSGRDRARNSGNTYGIDLDPESCGACGARLKPKK